MGDEKSELVDKLQAKLGRVLSSHEKEILESENFLGASELGFPEAAQKLLVSWRSSFKKTALLYRPGMPVSHYASHALLRQYKKLDRNFVAVCIAITSLFIMAVLLIVFLLRGSTATQLSSLTMLTLLFGVVASAVWDTRRQLNLFRQNDGLKTIILDTVNNSIELKEIYTGTPRPWREIFLGSPPKDMEGISKLVAWNLDWYLERPSVHFRWSWVAAIIIPVCSFALMLGVEHNLSMYHFILSGAYAFFFLYGFESWRKLTGLALLIEETKRIFSETENQ